MTTCPAHMHTNSLRTHCEQEIKSCTWFVPKPYHPQDTVFPRTDPSLPRSFCGREDRLLTASEAETPSTATQAKGPTQAPYNLLPHKHSQQKTSACGSELPILFPVNHLTSRLVVSSLQVSIYSSTNQTGGIISLKPPAALQTE